MIHRPKTMSELIQITRKITNKKRYLLIESKDERPILVSILTANQFNVGIDLINDSQYNRLTEYFEQYGSIATIERLANTVSSSQKEFRWN